MKKILLALVTISLLLSIPIQVKADTTNAQVMQDNKQTDTNKISERNGILLDVARFPMDQKQICTVIDQMDPNKFSYLVLHLNDDSHVAIQLKNLKNKDTKDTLSASDLKAIVKHAKEHGIVVIPDFDTPGHCKALIKLIRKHHPYLAKKIVTDSETLNFSNKATIRFMKKIYAEINSIFQGQQVSYLLMGGDEVAGGINNNKKLVHYFNQLNQYENQHDFKTIVWNDALRKENKLSDKITVAYWSQSGNAEKKSDIKERKAKRATVTQLKDHPIINANSIYNYIMVDQLNNQTEVTNFIQNFKQNNPRNFNEIDTKTMKNNGQTLQSKVPTTGQLVCLWEGNPDQIKVEQIIDFVKKLNQ